MNMYDAPFEQLIKLTAIPNSKLANELNRVGLRVGSEFHKHLSKIPQTLRIRVPDGSVMLGPNMTKKILIKCGKEVKPLEKILFQDNAVVEKITGGKGFQTAIGKLGIEPGVKIHLIHRLPKMEYVIRINGSSRIKISEVKAARILGFHEDGKIIQLSAARVTTDFTVTDIAIGGKGSAFLKELGIAPKARLTLVGVEASKDIFFSQAAKNSDVCIKLKNSGARIHLSNEKAKLLKVKMV